jgi:hypothetical protein
MAFSFFPLGMPFSSSYAINASFAVTTSLGGFPQTASLAEYVVNYIGPTGSAYETVTLLRYTS